MLTKILPRLAFAPAQSAPRGDTLVVIFLRGAADVLNTVVPHGETAYYNLRPSLGIPRPDDNRAQKEARTIDLDGFFGLHPELRPLLEMWQEKHLAIIHACGAPDESRSHFKAMELMERGVDDERGPASGWIGRHLATLDTGQSSSLRAIGLGRLPQRSLSGSVPVSVMRSIADFHLGNDPRATAQMRAALKCLYSDDLYGQETLHTLDLLQNIDSAIGPGQATPSTTTNQYPDSDFGLALHQTALLTRAEVGLEVAAIDLGGWDTHFAQSGIQANLLKDLSQGLAAFHAEMRDHLGKLTVVTMSEFGRRAAENGSLGTDHGHGSLMMVMGGHVNGGQIHGQWPGLATDQLVGPGDLAVTTDYRDVLGEIIQKRLNNSAIHAIFPGYAFVPGRIVGQGL
jgi:uncharacterized protein (DUF1501 family)